jgi:hypothetical protein
VPTCSAKSSRLKIGRAANRAIAQVGIDFSMVASLRLSLQTYGYPLRFLRSNPQKFCS